MGLSDLCKDYQECTNQDPTYAKCLANEIECENLDYVKWLLLDKKINPNLLLPGQCISAMHLLAGMENEYFTVEIIHLALNKCGGDPNVRSKDGLTPVHLAAMWGRCKVLELLLNFGGDPDLIEYKTALNAEDLALREHQWHSHAILVTFAIMSDSDVDCCLKPVSFKESEYESLPVSAKYINTYDFNSHLAKSSSENNFFKTLDSGKNKECTKETQTDLRETQLMDENPSKQGAGDQFGSVRKNSDSLSEKSLKLQSGTKSSNETTSSKISRFLRSILIKTKLSKKKI